MCIDGPDECKQGQKVRFLDSVKQIQGGSLDTGRYLPGGPIFGPRWGASCYTSSNGMDVPPKTSSANFMLDSMRAER